MMYSKYTGLGEASLFKKIGMVKCICDRGVLFFFRACESRKSGYKVAVGNDRFAKECDIECRVSESERERRR